MNIFLNLLPPERKTLMRKHYYWRYFLGLWIVALFIAILALAMMVLLYGNVELQQKKLSGHIVEEENGGHQEEYAKYEKKFEETNASVKSTLAFLSLHTSFSNLLAQIESSLPENTKIEKISTQSYKVFLVGIAPNRDAFLQFQENLKKNTCFENFNTPLSNLFSETNVQFEVDFTVKAECLRGSFPKL